MPKRTPLPCLALLGALLAPLALPLPAQAQSDSIVAVVNGDAITRADIDARTRLFALSTGMPMSPEVLTRLQPQIRRQLIDERLRLQEIQRRHIVVQDKDIADSIASIEKRNNMPPGTLQHRLQAEGVTLRTLVDELRVQIGWLRLLSEQLGSRAHITDAEVADQLAQTRKESGQPEYRVSEIFIPVDDPSHAEETQRFADTVIAQLRAGAPFPVVAAQFSQSQTALEGGDLGWLRGAKLDPEVAKIVAEMPVGAISNPIRVAGGYDIVSLRARREIGRDVGTVLSMRQVFIPFSTTLNPAAPTEQQRKAVEKANQIARTARGCDAIEEANREAGNTRPSDPGEIRLESVTPPAFRAVLDKLPVGKPSTPLISNDGVAVVMVCSRDQKNLAEPTKKEIELQMLDERAELASRQLLRDLRRRAAIDLRS